MGSPLKVAAVLGLPLLGLFGILRQIGDHVSAILTSRQTGKCHFRARDHGLWIFQIVVDLLFSPNDARLLICGGIAEIRD